MLSELLGSLKEKSMGGNREGLHREEKRRRKEMFWYIAELSILLGLSKIIKD